MSKRVLTVLLCLLLTGCHPKELLPTTAEAVQKTLAADCHFTAVFCCNDLQGEAEVTHRGDELTVTLAVPASLAGLSFRLQGAEATMRMGEIEMTLPQQTLREEAVVSLLHRVLTAEDAITVTETEDGIEAAADCVLFRYGVTLQGDPLTPVAVTVPELGITITIQNYRSLATL